VDAPVAVKAAVVEWVVDAPVAAMARVEVVQAAVALALEVEAPWAAAAWPAAVLALGDRGKWSRGLQEPPVKSPGI
ncbi:MAG: hypothetical protein ACKN94_04055, partial [Pirellulaceae bacterium]